MPLINCEINLDLNCSENCVIVATDVTAQATNFSITDKKLCFSCTFIELLTFLDFCAKMLEQLKSGFKSTIDWNKYQPKLLFCA